MWDSRETATRAPPTSSLIDLGRVTWHRVAYDIGRVQSAMRSVRPRSDWSRGYRSGCDGPDAAGRRVIGGRRSLQGRKPGDRRVRVERPHAPYFRYTGKGQLTAKEAASVPTTPVAD